jgi:hypothetical protein
LAVTDRPRRLLPQLTQMISRVGLALS